MTAALRDARIFMDLQRRDAGISEAEVLETAASLEISSAHPLAKAILAESEKRGMPVSAAADFAHFFCLFGIALYNKC